jgi:D-arabinitol dehydrogenase (NADP+)
LKALVYEKPKKFSIRKIEIPRCGKKQVLIKVKSCGICGTDIHIHTGGFIYKFPLTPGHEFSGVVEETGSGVTSFQEGDRVVADNTILCGHCYYCRRNQPLFCENFYSLGNNKPGGFAEYVVVDEEKVFSIDENLSFDEAAFTEPLSCIIHGMDVIDVQPGDDVLLFGSGPSGVMLAQLLKYCGAGNLVVAAPTKFKLNILNELGIHTTVQINRSDYSVHEKKIKGMFPNGFDIVIDATGASDIVEQCIKFTKYGAKIIVYGVCEKKDMVKINPYEIFRKELKIIGSFAQTHCFDRSIKYLENKIVRVDKLITHRFNLENYEEALNVFMNEKNKIKVIINP